MGREKAQAQISGEMLLTDTTAIRLSVGGALSDWNDGKGRVLPDNSYIAQKIGGAVVYAGYLYALVGPWLDFGAVAFQQCAPHAADRHLAAQHLGLSKRRGCPGSARGKPSSSSAFWMARASTRTRSIADCA